jgi:exonuclease SbcC
MKIKRIKLKNIRSYKEQEIEFPDGSTLLWGDIGSGKTSILLGIEFALFGLQPGQRGNSILRNSSDNGSVELEIDVDGKNIIIERTMKRTKTVNQDYCAITIDGVKEELAVTELKSKILELLDYPQELSKKQNLLYKFTVYTPQEEMKQIIIEDSETRINTLRHVFGIDKYKKIIENAGTIASKLREEKRIKEALTATIEEDKEKIIIKEKNLEEKYLILKNSEKELIEKSEKRRIIEEEKESIQERREEKTKLQQETEKTSIMISNKEDSITENRKIIIQLKKQIEESSHITYDESIIISFEKSIKELKSKRDELLEENLALSSQASSLKLKISENEKVRAQLSHLEQCPTCLQEVTPVYKSNVINNIDNDSSRNNSSIRIIELKKTEINNQINTIRDKISENEKKIQELNLNKVRLQNLEEKKSRIIDLEKINQALSFDVDMLEKHFQTLKSSILEFSKYDNLFEIKLRELQDSLRGERNAEIKVAELKKEIYLFEKQIEELKERMSISEQIKNEAQNITNLENWISKKFIPLVSHIEKNVMLKLKSEFSRTFQEWFSMLVPENFSVRLDENFTPIVEQYDYEIDYSYLSGGERTAVALAYRLSLNQVINSLLSKIKTRDLVILDEPTDGFSSQQLDKMRDVLDELNVGQLIIVSHEQKIEGFVENVIKLKKEHGLSGIQES